jgi:hypothetical protein
LNADFAGPILPDGSYLLVIQDQHSRYPVVEIIHSTSADTVIPVFDRVLSAFGNVLQITTDNGPPWTSYKWSDYMQYMGIEHRRVCPLWPRANGIVERLVSTVLKAIRVAHSQGKNWQEELSTFLRDYRNTPHSTTGRSPAEILFGRKLRSRLPQYDGATQVETQLNDSTAHSDWRMTDSIKKRQYKKYADRRNRARPRFIAVGDRVLVRRNQRNNKLTSLFDNRPYIVSHVRGTMITARRQGHTITRNISFYKLLPPTVATPVLSHEEEEEGEIDDIPLLPRELPRENMPLPEPIIRRYPLRNHRPPARLADYVPN